MQESDFIDDLLRDPLGTFMNHDNMLGSMAADAIRAGRKPPICMSCLDPAGLFWLNQLRCTLDGNYSHIRQVCPWKTMSVHFQVLLPSVQSLHAHQSVLCRWHQPCPHAHDIALELAADSQLILSEINIRVRSV